MANLVHGKITGRGPVKTAQYPQGADIAFLAYPGDAKPPDLPPGLPYLTVLPLVATVDMDRLAKNWVPFTPKVSGKDAWCELPRFTPDAEEEPPETPGQEYDLHFNGALLGTVKLVPK